MNKSIISGTLTKEPYMTQGNTVVCKFTVKVPQYKEGYFDYIRVTVFGDKAKECGARLAEGSEVFVVGRIQTGSYDGKDGKKVYTTEIIAEEISFLNGGEYKPKEENKDDFDDFPQVDSDSIPF